MKGNTSLRTVEPLAAVRKHPMAATVGGLCTAIVCGLMGTLAEGGVVGMLMAAIGAIVGAPGAAHIADTAAEQERPV
jgi:predicted lipid-binding transport protein (Tim44 family)